jgi:hypothetical protein
VQFFVDRYYHPEAASTASFEKLLATSWTFMVIDFVTSSVAFSLERKHPANKGDGWLLFHIWLQRFAYRQVFSVVLFKTVKRAIDGGPSTGTRFARTAKMSKQTEEEVELVLEVADGRGELVPSLSAVPRLVRNAPNGLLSPALDGESASIALSNVAEVVRSPLPTDC